MALLAVCFGANQADREHINKVVSVANVHNWPLDIIDIRTSPIELKDVPLVFAFGDKAIAQAEALILKDKLNISCIHLPSIKLLYPVEQGGDEVARSKALKELLELQAALKESNVELFEDKKIADSIKADALPDFSIAKIQALEKAIRESGKSVWMCTTRDKKVLALTLEKVEVKADIMMTFSELIALRAAMDILDVQEVKFVSK